MNDRAHKRIFDFLTNDTDIRTRIIRRLATKKLEEIAKTTSKTSAINENELHEYIKGQYSELQKEADDILNDVIDQEIITKPFWKRVLCQFGILTVVLTFPFAGLIRSIFREFERADPSYADIANYVLGCCLIAILLIAAMISEFLKK